MKSSSGVEFGSQPNRERRAQPGFDDDGVDLDGSIHQLECIPIPGHRKVLATLAASLREQNPHRSITTSAPQNGGEAARVADLDKTHDLGIESGENILHVADIGSPAVAKIRGLWAFVERVVPEIEVSESNRPGRRGSGRKLCLGDAGAGETGAAHLHPKRQGQRDHPGNDDNYAQYE